MSSLPMKRAKNMTPPPGSEGKSFKTLLLEAVPSLRAFGMSLTGTADRADDLVQETLVKAWDKQSSFQMGSNINAWLFTILRNEFYSQMRKKGREISDSDGLFAAKLASHPEQDGHLDMEDFRRALQQLPEDQREALILVGATGLSYEEAAEVTGVAIGTVKSRVSRARKQLGEILTITDASAWGPDGVSAQVLNQPIGFTSK